MAASDRERLDWLLSNAVGLSPKDKRELKRSAKRAAREFVAREWAVIKRVAASLFERGRLTGDEVAHLIGVPRA
jgi:hypothetical protein